MDHGDRIRRQVSDAAHRLTEATQKLADLSRRKEFQRELRERGNWLANGPAEPPPWVKAWSQYWDRLARDPAHIALVEEARAARAALYSGEFERAIESLRLGEAGIAADWAIAYLEADPWYFRSGYFKASLSRWLRQVPLDEEQQARLRSAILGNLARGPRFDFTETCRLGRRLDSPGFRNALERLLKHPDPSTADRSRRLLAACAMNDTPGRGLRGAR